MSVAARVLQLFGVGGGALATAAFVVLTVAALLVAAPEARPSQRA